METFGRCQEPGCEQEALVGLQRGYFCIDHFKAALRRLRKTLAHAGR